MAKKKQSILSSAQKPQKELAAIGARFNGDLLIAHAENVFPKITEAFHKFGFGPEWTGAMHVLIDEIRAGSEKTVALDADALPTHHDLLSAMDRAKEWRRDAMTVAALVLRRVPAATGSSVSGLVRSMKKLIPIAGAASAARSGGGPAMKKDGQKLISELQKAEKAHAGAAAKLSPELRAQNAREGILYEELRRVALVARRVVPAEASLFSVKRHVHAHMQSRVKKETDGAAAAKTQGA